MTKKRTKAGGKKMKMDEVADLIAVSANNLVEFQGVVEKVYEKIAFSLPEIDSVIKQNDREAKSMLGMISSDQSGGGMKHRIGGMVTKANQSIELFSKQMQTMSKREQDLVKLVRVELKNVDSMKGTLGNIQIILSDIEMTTQGALEAADKKGSAGKSFRYLVKEVIKISNQSKLIVKNIMKLWTQLGGKTQSFFQTEQDMASLSPKTMKTLCTDMQKTFKTSTEHLQEMTLTLRDTVLKGENVDVAIMNIMEAMQNQDIIKQCMDNIIISLNETNYYARKHGAEGADISNLPEGEKKQFLDELSFQEEVPSLCKELLGNVEDQLKESNKSLETNIDTLQSAINNDVEPETKQKASKKKKKTEPVDLNKVLSQARAGIDSWFEDFNTAVAKKEKLLGICNHISILFDKMEKLFLFLRNVTFRFRLIVILSKTELMKTTVLSDHKITQKLNELTMQIDHFIKQADEQMKSIEGVIRQFMVSFGNNLNESSIKSSVFADEMNTCLENFSSYKGEISQTLANMNKCSDKLNILFKDFFEGVKQIEDVINKNAQTKKVFIEASKQIHLVREELQEGDVGGWKISDERLLSIINKFTVFSHKKIADEMFDLGIEEGDSGGDLTLF